MLVRVKNPIDKLTSRQKATVAIVGATVLVLGTVAVVATAAERKAERKAITIGPGCTSFTINDPLMLQDELRGAVRKALTKGPIDPFEVTSIYLKMNARDCSVYPANPRTPVEVQLFAAVFSAVLTVLQQEGLITAQNATTWHAMLNTWAAGHGVPASMLT